MKRLSKPQDDIVNIFYRWQNCRIVRVSGPSTEIRHYVVVFYNDGGKERYKKPNPRTVESLIRWGILVHNTKLDIYELAPEWQPKERNKESEAK